MYSFFVCCDATDGKIKLDKRREPKHATNLGLGCTSLSAGPEAGGLCLRMHISRVPQTLVPATVACSMRAAASGKVYLPPLNYWHVSNLRPNYKTGYPTL
jgi:hypothetical protein